MKIKSTNVHAFGTTIVIPIDGQVTLSNEGTVEVSQEAGELLIANSPNWSSDEEVKEVKKSKKAEEPKKSEETTEAVETAGEEVKEPEITKDSLNELEYDDLVEQALALEIPQKDIDSCKGKKVVLIAKILKALK